MIFSENKNRLKRGLFNVVGTASKWLFGTLDADDEITINAQLKTMTKNSEKV